MCGGGGYYGLKITAYGKKQKIGTVYSYESDASNVYTLYTYGKNGKLKKGTYYIRIESYSGGTGYFEIKWK